VPIHTFQLFNQHKRSHNKLLKSVHSPGEHNWDHF